MAGQERVSVRQHPNLVGPGQWPSPMAVSLFGYGMYLVQELPLQCY